jgi:hypothetical protein
MANLPAIGTATFVKGGRGDDVAAIGFDVDAWAKDVGTRFDFVSRVLEKDSPAASTAEPLESLG